MIIYIYIYICLRSLRFHGTTRPRQHCSTHDILAASASIAAFAEVITALIAALRKPFDSNVSTAAIVMPPADNIFV